MTTLLTAALRLIRGNTVTELNLSNQHIDAEGARQVADALKINNALIKLDLWGNDLGEDGARCLADALKTNTTLTTLNLWGNKIDNEGAHYLADALKTNTSLTVVDLGLNTFGAEGARDLADALKTNTTLTVLGLQMNIFGTEGSRYLVDALKTNTSLTTLDLQMNTIGTEGARVLADALIINKTLTLLNLRCTSIDTNGIHFLADALKINSTLTTLLLEGNDICADGARYLSDALRTNTTLTTLDLQMNTIGAEGVRVLADALMINNTLALLNLQNNNIGADGACSIVDALKTNNSLTTLSLQESSICADWLVDALNVNTALTKLELSETCIGDDDMYCLTNALKSNNTLTTLVLHSELLRHLQLGRNTVLRIPSNFLKSSTTLIMLGLTNNFASDDSVHHLVNALETNNTLAALSLCENNIGDDGAHHFANLLRTNSTLTTLDLRDNCICAHGVRHLATVLETSAVLTTLQLAENNIGTDGVRYLSHALKTNTILTTLDLCWNDIDDDGARFLADAIKANATLTILSLADNNIGDNGARALAENFKENAVVTRIDLRGNSFGEYGRRALAEGLFLQYHTIKMLVLTRLETTSAEEPIQSLESLHQIPSDILQGGLRSIIKYHQILSSTGSRRRVKMIVAGNDGASKTTILNAVKYVRFPCHAVHCLHSMPCDVELKGSNLILHLNDSPLRTATLSSEWATEYDGHTLILVPPETSDEPRIVLMLPPSSPDTTLFLFHIDQVLHKQTASTHTAMNRFSIKGSKGGNIEISAWGFVGRQGGPDCFYHFSSGQGLYVVVWDVSKQSIDDESNDLLFWLRLLSTCLPMSTKQATDHAAIIIVGTHLDLLPPNERDPASTSRKSRDQFVHETAARAGFVWPYETAEISAVAPLLLGHDQLRDLVSSVAGRLAGDGKLVPDSCIAIELLIDEIAATKKNQGDLPFIHVSDLCSRTPFPAKVVKDSLEILNTWGCVVYQPEVSDLIVLDPAAFLTPQFLDELLRPFQSVIAQGRLPDHYMDLLWPQHDLSLAVHRDAILSLMEHFGVCRVDPGTNTVVFPSRLQM